MEQSAFESLTPRERACLRLVHPERKSAVIAGALGIAVPTVETHLRSARRKLGGVSRFAAARMLGEYEANQAPTSHGTMIDDDRSGTHFAFGSHAGRPATKPATLNDVRAVFDHDADDRGAETRGDDRSATMTINRLALIAFTIMAIAVAGIASIPLSDSVQKVARMVMTQRR